MLSFEWRSEDLNQTLYSIAWRLHFETVLVQWSLDHLLEKCSSTHVWNEYGFLFLTVYIVFSLIWGAEMKLPEKLRMQNHVIYQTLKKLMSRDTDMKYTSTHLWWGWNSSFYWLNILHSFLSHSPEKIQI